jgi:DNA mismatch repair ATPase MutL
MIDKAYVAILSQRTGGPASKHHAPKGPQAPPHPCFILQLICSHECYDVLCEPDKTKAVFSDPYGLKLCVKKLLVDMLQKFCPDLIDTACSSFPDDREINMAKDCSRVLVKNDGQRPMDDDLYGKEDSISCNGEEYIDDSYLYSVRTKSDVDLKQEISHSSSSNSSVLQKEVGDDGCPILSKSLPISAFKAAFLETPPVELREMTRRSDQLEDMQSQPVSLFAEFEFSQSQQRCEPERVSYVSGNDFVSVNNEDQREKEENCSSQGSKADEFSMVKNIGIQQDNEIAVESMRVRGVTVSRIPDMMDKDLDGFPSPVSPSTSVCTDNYPCNSPGVMITNEFHYHDNDDQSYVSSFGDEKDCSGDDHYQESYARPSSSIDEVLEQNYEYKTVCNSDDNYSVNTVDESPLLKHSREDKRPLSPSEHKYARFTDERTDYNPLYKRGKELIGSESPPIICSSPTSDTIDPKFSYLDGKNFYDQLEGEKCSGVAHNRATMESDFSNFESADTLATPCQAAKEEAFNSLFFTTSEYLASISKRNEANQPKKKLYNKYEVKWIDPNNIEEIPAFVQPTSLTVGNKRSLNNIDYPVLPTPSMLDCDFDITNISKRRANQLDTKSCPIKPISTKITAMTLKKEMLVRSRTIGQVDSKYILVTNGNLLMIIDQHAADERVKLEVMLHGDGDSDRNESEDINIGSNERSITGVKVVHEILTLTESDIFILKNRSEIFHNWKFIYKFVSNIDPSSGDSVKEVNHSENSSSNVTDSHVLGVKLTQVPIIHGEALNGQDFVEFIESVSAHSHWMAPSAMLKPPSVKRIAASKACRTAIKFGDILNLLECTDMVEKLSKTRLPFQCAHGRPSVVPLLKQDEAHVMSPSTSSNNSLSRKDSKYIKGPNYSNLIKEKK